MQNTILDSIMFSLRIGKPLKGKDADYLMRCGHVELPANKKLNFREFVDTDTRKLLMSKFINSNFPPRDVVTAISERYSNKRVKLVAMYDDWDPIKSGELGTVDHVDGAGQVHVNWDNGRRLAVNFEAGDFVKIV